MRTDTAYPKAPVVEAVIDIQFDPPINHRTLERARAKLAKSHPKVDAQHKTDIDVLHRTISALDLFAYKMTSADATDVVLIRLNGVTTSRLAPYTGWETLFESARENFTKYKSVAAVASINRIATKFVNRLDIPYNSIDGLAISDFLNVGVALPNDIAGAVGSFTASITLIYKNTDIKVIITSSSLQEVLIGHVSIMFDIDVFLDGNISLKEPEFWAQIDKFRNVKNDIFEKLITERARGLMR